MKFPNPLAQLKALPKNQRAALGVGAAAAGGLGFYSYRKKKLTGSSTKPAAAANAVGSALQPAPDLSQYGQVAVLVPIDWQDGANFGGTGGLTGPLNPSNPSNPAQPVAAPGGGDIGAPIITVPRPPPTATPQPILVGNTPVPDLSSQVPPPVITDDSTTFYSFPQALAPPTQPVSFYNTNTGSYQTIQPGQPGALGSNVWAALLANPYTPPNIRAQASNAFSGIQSV